MNTKMVVCVLLLLSVVAAGATTTLTSTHIFTPTVSADTVSELTSGVGVTIDGVLIKDSEMAVSYVGDMGTQSFHNVLVNGDFESWSSGTTSSPDGWSSSGTGLYIARSTTHKSGVYGAQLQNGAGNEAYLQITPIASVYSGKTITYQQWVRASTADRSRLAIHDNQGSGYESSYSEYHSGNNQWELLTVTRTLRDSLTSLLIHTRVESGSSVTLYADGAILVEGSVCPAFSSKPITNDGIMFQSHTPSSASAAGVAGQWCYDTSYIYVCTTDDTWKRAAISTW